MRRTESEEVVGSQCCQSILVMACHWGERPGVEAGLHLATDGS